MYKHKLSTITITIIIIVVGNKKLCILYVVPNFQIGRSTKTGQETGPPSSALLASFLLTKLSYYYIAKLFLSTQTYRDIYYAFLSSPPPFFEIHFFPDE